MSRRGEGAAACLRFDERPSTPDGIRKYRKSYFSEPGTRVMHRGLIGDAEKLRERLEDQRLGSRSNKTDVHVADLFAQRSGGALQNYLDERKESIYKTVQREPLGKPYVRGHKFEQLDAEAARRKPAVSETAKQLIYASEEKMDDEERARTVREQYVRSHQSYQPGEQKRRGYNWKEIDPSLHRFGVAETQRKDEGVAFCLQPEQELGQETLVNSAVANHRATTAHRLGKPKYRGNLDPATVASLESRAAERRYRESKSSCTAQDCIEGDYGPDQQQPDPDLGRAVRPGWRNTNTDRVYGAPTVRTDIPAPTTRSVSDNQNYGDDTTASTLLYPSRFVAAGLQDSDFLGPCHEEDLRDIMERCGYAIAPADFDRLYKRACEVATGAPDTPGEVVSVQGLLAVLNERLRANDDGVEPTWWSSQ